MEGRNNASPYSLRCARTLSAAGQENERGSWRDGRRGLSRLCVGAESGRTLSLDKLRHQLDVLLQHRDGFGDVCHCHLDSKSEVELVGSTC